MRYSLAHMNDEVSIYCPDCRGLFHILVEDIIEGDLLECGLCAAEIEVLSEDPIQLRLYSEENEF